MVVFLRKANVAAASPSQQSSLRILRIIPGNIGYILKNLLLDQFGKKVLAPGKNSPLKSD